MSFKQGQKTEIRHLTCVEVVEIRCYLVLAIENLENEVCSLVRSDEEPPGLRFRGVFETTGGLLGGGF